MRIFYQYSDVSEYIGHTGTVTALGNFDGVHIGHAEIIKETVRLAKAHGLLSCVYTFSEHPGNFKSDCRKLITDNREKALLVEELGADILFFDDFSTVKELSCERFCEKILFGALSCRIAVCGKNHLFGKNRSGDPDTLSDIMKEGGGRAFVCGDVTGSTGNGFSSVSSTFLRKAISDGNIELANSLMFRPYFIFGEVVHGMQLARRMGAPTVNQIIPPEKLCPKNGVYACICRIEGEEEKKYIGVANVGTKPTVTSGEEKPPLICETHIIGYSGEIYGKNVRVDFYKMLREEKKFPSLEALEAQIKADVNETKDYFAGAGKEGLLL